MPRVSYFYGIGIYMYHRDHALPHFHAIYAEHEAEIEIATATVKQGALPRRAQALATEWAAAHRDELLVNWQLARLGQPLNLIPPLE
jgi:hypothetical protein